MWSLRNVPTDGKGTALGVNLLAVLFLWSFVKISY